MKSCNFVIWKEWISIEENVQTLHFVSHGNKSTIYVYASGNIFEQNILMFLCSGVLNIDYYLEL